MSISGITINKQSGYVICHIDDFSDELKKIIRDELNYICHGKTLVDEDTLKYYSYTETIKDFLDRYAKKTTKTKTGMMGELMAHLLVARILPELQIVSRFFNKEEASIKKGFDLIYVNDKNTVIWYGEVKAGQLSKSSTVDIKNNELLGRAKKDIKKSLAGDRARLWDNAVIDVGLTIASGKKNTVQDLLKSDILSIKKDSSVKKNAILISVLFHDISEKITSTKIESYLAKIKSENIFSDLILFSIQKSTYKKIESFLEEEVDSI